MTIGEKIKYCRKQIGITQDKLAELTGIHPVSIRKYETNKMQPQPPQLEKIAAALGVSYNALNGSDTAGLRLETVGDLMGVLMVLCNSGILQISGERGEDKLLKDDTVSIHLNPVLSSYLEIGYTSRGKAHTLSLQDALLNIRSYKVFNDLLKRKRREKRKNQKKTKKRLDWWFCRRCFLETRWACRRLLGFVCGSGLMRKCQMNLQK